MRIAIISDTHNDQNLIQRALTRIGQEDISVVLHAGDVTSARVLHLFKDYDLWIARGNMDHDPALASTAEELFGAGRYKAAHTLELDGHSLAMVHDGDSLIARDLVRSRGYAYLIHGHTHQVRDERLLSTRVINPGAIGKARWRPPSFAILDLATDDLTIIRI